MKRILWLAGVLLTVVIPQRLSADTIITTANSISITGAMDPNNPEDLRFIEFSLAAPTDLTVQTWGWGGTTNTPGGTNAAGQVIAAGGFDPFVALYSGTGPSAVYLGLNDEGLCPPGNAYGGSCHDSTLTGAGLAAGSYTLVLGVFENLPFPAFGVGNTLGDGFVGLGFYFNTTSNFAVDLLANGIQPGGGTTAVPEPSSFVLFAIGLAALGIKCVGNPNRVRI
jgi:PEP-CTERM motif